jgi:prepilin-type processing-associated H-X9-DG protein
MISAPAEAQDDSSPISTAMIPAESLAVVAVYPSELMASPEVEMMPTEIASAWTLENIGVDIAKVKSITAVTGMPGPTGPEFGMIIRLTEDFDTRLLNRKLVGGAPQMIGGYRAIPLAGLPNIFLHRADAQTFVMATPDFLVKMIGSSGETGPLVELLSGRKRTSPMIAAVVMGPIRDQVAQAAGMLPPDLPGPLRDLVDVPDLTEGVVIEANISAADSLRLTLLANSDADAQELETILTNAMTFGRDLGVMQAMQGIEGNGPVPEATRNYVRRLAERLTELLQPQREGRELVIAIDNQAGIASTGVLVGLLLPAVQAAREAARRMSSSNNLKQIMLAFHNYHDTYRHLPEAISRDDDGKPLLSWRVAILPFIDQQALYEQFHLDEPWDSEHNIELLKTMPAVYIDPSVSLEPGLTVYQVPVGEGLMFTEEETTSFRDILDGTSNTIAVFEARAEHAVPWTKPADVEIDPEDPLASMGNHRPGGFNVGFGDGSVRFIAESIDRNLFWALLTRAGGEVVNANF